MTKWIVRRWVRGGHDRLYAETPGGTPLGYLDLRTGMYHSDERANLPLLEYAIAEHRGLHRPTTPAPEPYPPAPPPAAGTAAPAPCSPDSARAVAAPAAAVPAPPVLAPAGSVPAAPAPWQDLSTTRPGAAARERALAERKAQGRLGHWVARLVGARTDERSWRVGADGEEAVAQQLALLDPRWRVLHAVPVGERSSDIDHVVIGPAGVFTVNAKHHPSASIWVGGNTFLVNGRRVHYIRNSRHEALRAARLLTARAGFPVTAVGIIAVMGARRGMTVKQQPRDGRVVVVQRRHISQYLSALPVRLTLAEADAIFEVARRSTTWR